ncbi:hypothetical protein F5B19DRAFT_187411 [Rostrohypoxylon terebratum]|nr:hypothetical protein F5B19DRAFT_187411 [Rostrohypoxylon terebratum]
MMNSLDRLQRERREAEDALLAEEESSRKDIEDLLDSQRKKVEVVISSQRDRVAELVGRIRRLRRQEDVVKEKVIGVLHLEEELDREEEEEARRREPGAQQATTSVASPSFFSGINFDLGPLSPSTAVALGVVDQDFGGESPQAGPSNASHA